MSGGVSYWNGLLSGSGGGGGGGGNSALPANVVNIPNAASSIAVIYSSTIAVANVPVFSFINIIDATPIFLQGMITASSTTGFTVTFNTATDTANYKLSYIVSGVV